MKLATAVLVVIAALLFIPVAHADGTPTGGFLQYNVTADFGTYVDLQASYVLENIGSPITCPGMSVEGFCNGGDLVVIPGSISYSTSGPVGPFALLNYAPNDFNFYDAAHDYIQIDFLAGNYWQNPGTYSAQDNVVLYCGESCFVNDFTPGGRIVVTELSAQGVPEPKTLGLLALGLVGLIGLAGFRKLPHVWSAVLAIAAMGAALTLVPVAHADGAPERFTVDTTFEVVPFDPSLPSGVETFMASYEVQSIGIDEFALIGPVTCSSSGPLAPFDCAGGGLNFTDASGAQIQIQYESIVNSWFVDLTLGTGYTEGFQMNGVPAGQPVPEPGTWALLLSGIGLVLGTRFRRTA